MAAAVRAARLAGDEMPSLSCRCLLAAPLLAFGSHRFATSAATWRCPPQVSSRSPWSDYGLLGLSWKRFGSAGSLRASARISMKTAQKKRERWRRRPAFYITYIVRNDRRHETRLKPWMLRLNPAAKPWGDRPKHGREDAARFRRRPGHY
jgi:hypothetical protein